MDEKKKHIDLNGCIRYCSSDSDTCPPDCPCYGINKTKSAQTFCDITRAIISLSKYANIDSVEETIDEHIRRYFYER